MKLLRLVVVLAGVLAATSAFAGDVHEGLLGIQLTNGTADLYSPDDPADINYITAYDHSEIGIGIQYWRLMSRDYAFTLSAGIGAFSETNEPGPNAGSGAPDFEYSQSSWSVRVGGDRAVKVGDRAILYFGPGLEMWSGKAKFEGGSFSPAYETENVMRLGISGRVGGVMLLSGRVGLNCQIGRYVGKASAEEAGAKASWWASGFQGSGGLIIRI